VSSYELLSREFNLFPHDFGLIGRAFSKSPSLPPQQSGGDSERERKEGRPDRSGKKRIIVVACALGCIAGAVIGWPYKKKPRKLNGNNRQNKDA